MGEPNPPFMAAPPGMGSTAGGGVGERWPSSSLALITSDSHTSSLTSGATCV